MTAPQYSVRIRDVELDDEFWTPWVTRNRDVTIEYQYDQLEDSGGPLVYCAEGVDNGRPLHQYSIPSGADVDADHREDVLDGVTVVEVDAEVPTLDEWEGSLYLPDDETGGKSSRLTMVPYFSWDNREPGEMRVWTRAE